MNVQSKFFEEFTRSRATFEKARTENLLRNSQLSLVQQCYWLQTAGFLNDANKEVFSSNENFSSLLPCFEVNLNRQNASIKPPGDTSASTTELPLPNPPVSTTESPEPESLRIQNVR